MRKIAVLFAVVALSLIPFSRCTPVESATPSVDAAFESHSNDVEVSGEGEVARMLPDDVEGSRHQRFIVRLDSGRTVLVTHNIDVAPRVSSLHPGDRISFHGEYVWNPKGGLVHWTHRDPAGHHEPGWLEHNGEKFQ